MPKGNRTGPEGFGPRTGRAMGYCSGSNAPGYTIGPSLRRMVNRRGRGQGCGYGRGRMDNRGSGQGRGYGRRGIFPVDQIHDIESMAPSTDEERSYLENMADGLEKELSDIKKRIEDLGNEE